MTAFLIMTRLRTYDQDALATYSGLAAMAPARSAKIVASTKLHTVRVLEGKAPDALAVVRFETSADALAWYESPEYAAARSVRQPAGDFSVVLIDDACAT